jgi:ABC-2 type transport system ATP-binding protein
MNLRTEGIPVLAARDLVIAYGRRRVIDGLDLQLEPGEILALLGSNGAGKTTLLSALTGQRRPASGSVRVLGQDPCLRLARCHFGTMQQDGELPPSFRAGELIEFFRRLYPAPLPMDRILKLSRLEGLSQTPFGKLSGGQKQRLKLALAAAGDPPLLILDEPTVAMDMESRQQFSHAIAEMVAAGKSVLLTTHDLHEVDRMAHRIAILHGGKIVRAGSPEQIKATLGGRLLQFRSTSATVEMLRQLPGVDQAQGADGWWSLRSSQAERTLRVLFQGECDISHLTVRSFGLEEALAALTTAATEKAPS